MTMHVWALASPVSHPETVARAAHSIATGGKEGITSPADLAVTAQTVPAGSVKVAPGTATVRAKSPNHRQSYAVENTVEAVANVAATGASARTDMVLLQVQDPPVSGVAAVVFVKSGVPATARTAADAGVTKPAIPLARVTIPANTGAITQAMITDLRDLANPRRETMTLMNGIGAAGPEETASNTTGARFFAPLQPMVDIPAWATHVDVIATIAQLGVRGGKAIATVAVSLGTTTDVSAVTQFRSANTYLHEDGADHRLTAVVGGSGPIPAGLIGTTQRLSLEAKRWTSSGSVGQFVAVAGTHVVFQVTFSERLG